MCVVTPVTCAARWRPFCNIILLVLMLLSRWQHCAGVYKFGASMRGWRFYTSVSSRHPGWYVIQRNLLMSDASIKHRDPASKVTLGQRWQWLAPSRAIIWRCANFEMPTLVQLQHMTVGITLAQHWPNVGMLTLAQTECHRPKLRCANVKMPTLVQRWRINVGPTLAILPAMGRK